MRCSPAELAVLPISCRRVSECSQKPCNVSSSPSRAAVNAGLRLVRPDMRMFDPGWRTQHRGWPDKVPPEDQGTRDSGNDPEGVVSR